MTTFSDFSKIYAVFGIQIPDINSGIQDLVLVFLPEIADFELSGPHSGPSTVRCMKRRFGLRMQGFPE
jgi:hypothetical protein